MFTGKSHNHGGRRSLQLVSTSMANVRANVPMAKRDHLFYRSKTSKEELHAHKEEDEAATVQELHEAVLVTTRARNAAKRSEALDVETDAA